jgi:PAS domain S-box-containing protein
MEREFYMDRSTNGKSYSSLAKNSQDIYQKLLELQGKKEAIIEKTGDAVFVVHSSSGDIFEANGVAAALTGYPLSELQGMNFENLVPKENIMLKKVALRSLNGNGMPRAFLRKKDGTSQEVELSAHTIQMGQKPQVLVIVRKPGQDELARLEDLRQYFAKKRSLRVASEPPEPEDGFPNIIGKSDKIRGICHLIGQVAKTDCTVLIQGESGTGKEIVAQVIHFHSSRSGGPFVKVNCAALSETLLESEIFGHVKGAFTGAIRDRKGRFKQADGGTIFLDEIGCMSLTGQAKLLRVLEEREFEPVGSSNTIPVNVRIIAASKINLKQSVEEGRFREDLYYRLNVFSIEMPSLREKKEDIPLLVMHFLRKYNLAIGKEIREILPETLDLMMRYNWPGNVRELKNAVEHAVIVAKGPVILPSHLPLNSTLNSNDEENTNTSEGLRLPDMTDLGLRDRLNYLEKEIVLDALNRANGIKKQAAEMLQIDPRNFSYLLRKHNLTETDHSID